MARDQEVNLNFQTWYLARALLGCSNLVHHPFVVGIYYLTYGYRLSAIGYRLSATVQ